MKSSDIDRITSLFPFFSNLSGESWTTAEIITVHPSTPHSIREGHILQHAVFIVSGCIRIYKTSESGREITLHRVGGGHSCVLMMASVLGETAYEASASIDKESELLLLPVGLFKKWMDDVLPLRQFIFQQMMQRMISVTTLLDHVAFKSIHFRLADYLISTTIEPYETLFITHDRLAIELGTAREVISRTLKDLEKQDFLVLGRGQIQQIDRSALQKVMDQHSL